MSADFDCMELAVEGDRRIQFCQADAARGAGIFSHLITLPAYHTDALSTDNPAFTDTDTVRISRRKLTMLLKPAEMVSRSMPRG